MTLKQQQWQTFFQESLIPFLERQPPHVVLAIVEPASADTDSTTAQPFGAAEEI